jgi:hypothetical protein
MNKGDSVLRTARGSGQRNTLGVQSHGLELVVVQRGEERCVAGAPTSLNTRSSDLAVRRVVVGHVNLDAVLSRVLPRADGAQGH